MATAQHRSSPAVLRACEILDLLLASQQSLSVGDIAKRLAYPRNSTYEIVRALATHQLVELTGAGRYRIGLHAFELGSEYAKSTSLATEGLPIAEQTSRECNETVHVGMLDQRDIVYLVKVDGNHTVRMQSTVGGRLPAHATALGKAILSTFSATAVQQLYSGHSLQQLTPNTIRDVPRLLLELADARADGYAKDHGESSREVQCVGAPVIGQSGTVEAGISISVPISRMSAQRETELGGLVVDAAAKLSARLTGRHAGYVPSVNRHARPRVGAQRSVGR